MRPDRIVLEAPTATVFWASGGRLRTPSLGAGILASITRDRLLAELEVEQGEFLLEEVLGADEVFLASTVREVQPVSEIDGTSLPAPGALTEEAISAFRLVLARELPRTTA